MSILSPSRSSRPRAIAASIACIVTFSGFAAACGPAADKADDVASLGTQAPATDGTGATDGSGSPTSSSVDPQDAFAAFTGCMRDNGIDMPDAQVVQASPASGGSDSKGGAVIAGGPVIAISSADGSMSGVGPNGIDPSSAEYQAAQKECQPILDDAMGQITIDPEVEAEQRANMLAFAKCMRDQGIDFPDPVFSANGSVSINASGDEGGPAPDSDVFEAANKACADVLGDSGMVFSSATASAP